MTKKEMDFMIKFFGKLAKPSKELGLFPKIQAQYKPFGLEIDNFGKPGWLITADWEKGTYGEKDRVWKYCSIYLEDSKK